MLKGRVMRLKFNDHKLDPIIIDNGIRQGDPLLMVLYQYYNADLLDIPSNGSEMAAAYMDNAILRPTLVATTKTFKETHKILEEMMTREGSAMQWANEHNSKFELSKLALIDFAHHSKKVKRPLLTISGTKVCALKSAKYLGLYIDQHLSWTEQEAYTIKKGTIWVVQIRQVVRPDWGLTPKFAQCMYISIAIPRLLMELTSGQQVRRVAALQVQWKAIDNSLTDLPPFKEQEPWQ
ncbi:hypothetical protein EI94DRAFT_1586169 [Lactarius quietus]|nr:hypothetical protein EI94DRAFT_1586169 [Lactarius quietus]